MSGINSKKALIRQEIKEQRKLLTPEELGAYDADLLAEFKAVLKEDSSLRKAFDKASSVAVYKATGGELPCDALASYIRSRGKKTLYPKTSGDGMAFYDIKDPEKELVPGNFGIQEPSGGSPYPDDKVDIMIMPGVAFDEEGRRVGHGKGFYDRWLSKLPEQGRPLLIGVCMRFQLMTEVPSDSSDIPADMVLCI